MILEPLLHLGTFEDMTQKETILLVLSHPRWSRQIAWQIHGTESAMVFQKNLANVNIALWENNVFMLQVDTMTWQSLLPKSLLFCVAILVPLLPLVTLDDMTQIEAILLVLRLPRWPRQIGWQNCGSESAMVFPKNLANVNIALLVNNVFFL